MGEQINIGMIGYKFMGKMHSHAYCVFIILFPG